MDFTNLPLWGSLLLLLGLVTRVTRLVTSDAITQPLRNKIHNFGTKDRIYNMDKQDYTGGSLAQKLAHFVSKLSHCDWCTSVWVGAAAVLGFNAWGDTSAWNLVALAASLSYVASWVLSKEYSE